MRSFPALSLCFAAALSSGTAAPAPSAAPKTAVPAASPVAPVKEEPAAAVPDKSVKPAPTAAKTPSEDAYRQMELLTRAMETIRQSYVDESQVTYEMLVEGALEGMLRKLDPHCEYMGHGLFEELKREQSDESEGVGISVALREGALTIISVREDGPAARAGVMAGDQMVRINEILTDSVGVAEAVQLLSGKAGESLKLTVRRPSTRQFLEFSMVRETLSETSVHDAMLFTPKLAGDFKIGYARISQFTQATARDLGRALDELEKQGMQAFVLDLRNNPGGLLDSAVAVCGEFLPEGTVVVTTEGRAAAQNPPPYRTPSRRSASAALSDVRHHQPCQRQCCGNHGGRPAGSEARHRGRHDQFRQGQRAEHHSDEKRRRHADDHRQILHPEPPDHSRARGRAGHRLDAQH